MPGIGYLGKPHRTRSALTRCRSGDERDAPSILPINYSYTDSLRTNSGMR
jgi:hypothetical protein